ncbi:MAG: S-adenosylmethionine synthetase [Alphaproteobacteria bacterium]|jgi:S-adenosylmethionine synthetase
MQKNFLFTSESVSEGHPDKVCDRISDAILDAYLTEDPEARVAVETLVTKNLVTVAGEVRSHFKPNIDNIIRTAIRKIGYISGDFNAETVEIINRIHGQSAEIAMGVDEGETKEEGAGDQGLMFGYAVNETPELMPAPIYYAHKIMAEMAKLRHAGETRLGPDAKSQVTLIYKNGKPVGADTIVVSHQHREDVTSREVKEIVEDVIARIFPAGWVTEKTRLYVNPTGSFNYGGPGADTGLTGRKIIVDTYGGMSRHGGGAFSGKDPTKVDRSAAYAARYLAKNVVAAGLADSCEIQLCYAIGISEPLAVYLDTFGTANDYTDEQIAAAVKKSMKLSPRGIREHLKLNKPIYERTAAYGHFGRKPTGDFFTWEATDLVDTIKANL